MSSEVWSAQWPTVPGDYLFFGGSRRTDWVKAGPAPEFTVVRVRMSGNGHPMYVGGGRFFYPEEMIGVFRCFDEPFPTSWENAGAP